MPFVGRHLGKIIQRIQKINGLHQKAWLRDCATSRCMLFRCWDLLDPYPSQTMQLSRLRPMPCNALLQAHANAIPTNLLCVGSVCGLGSDLVGIHSLSLAARYRTAGCSNTLIQGLQKIQAAREYEFAPMFALSSDWEKNFWCLPWLVALRMPFTLYGVWTTLANLMMLHKTKGERLPQLHSVTNYSRMILLGLFSLRASRILGPISRFRVAESLPHMKLASCASRPGLTVVVFYASFAIDFVRHIDFTLRERHRCVELVARMNPTLSHTTTNVG